MLNNLTKSPLARVGLVAGVLIAGTAATVAAPLSVAPQTTITAQTETLSPTDVRYVRHYRSSGGRAFAGAALGILGLGIGAAIANSRDDYYPYGYGYAPTYYPYYAYGPSYGRYYAYAPHRRFAPYHYGYRGRGFEGRRWR